MRRCLLVALLLVAAPSSLVHAQAVPTWAASAASAVSGAVRTYSEAEIISLVEGGTVRKAVTWGTRIRYAAGGFALLGVAVYSYLEWFYEEAQRLTGTSLDEWWNWESQGSVVVAYFDVGTYYMSGENYLMNGSGQVWNVDHTLVMDVGPGGFWNCEQRSEAACVEYAVETYYDWPDPEASKENGPVYVGNDRYEWYAESEPKPSLLQWLQNHPDAHEGVREAVADAVEHDISNASASQAKPSAGVTFDPMPNPNQRADEPWVRDIDTDGDGWNDYDEEQLGTDPNTGTSQPDPNGDADGDGATNYEEEQGGTDPLDPDSKPGEEPDPEPQPDPQPDPKPDPDPTTLECGDLACESTLAEVRDSAEEIEANSRAALTELREQTGLQREMKRELQRSATPHEEVLTDVTPTYDEWVPFQNTSTAFEDAKTSLETSINDTWAVMQTKMPFGFVSWVPTPASVGSWECPVYDVAFVLDTTLSIAPCDNPLDDFLRNAVRPMLVALIYIGFMFAVVRTVAYT